jgi:hypothetical protein
MPQSTPSRLTDSVKGAFQVFSFVLELRLENQHRPTRPSNQNQHAAQYLHYTVYCGSVLGRVKWDLRGHKPVLRRS